MPEEKRHTLEPLESFQREESRGDPAPVRRARWSGILLLLVAVSLLMPARSQANMAEDVGRYSVDVLILRPSAALGTVIGAGLFVPAAILTSPMGRDSIEQAWNIFVETPAHTLYKKPLGDP